MDSDLATTKGFSRVRTLAALLLGLSPFCVGVAPMAAERSVTIIEGVEEPPPNPVPPPIGTAPLAEIRTENPAGVRLDILPNGVLHIGTRIAFKVSTQHPGYLIIVDINADGRLTQIYPNMMSLSRSSGNVAVVNLIKPRAPVTIPNMKNPLARFVFTADPPRGTGVIVAILSDRPVQLIDLPEPPTTPQDAQTSVDALTQSVINLKIAAADRTGAFTPGVWSFAATPYVIE